MKKKCSSRSKPNLQSDDAAILVACVLAYEKLIPPADKIKRQVFLELRKISLTRKPVAFASRECLYFWSVFPYDQFVDQKPDVRLAATAVQIGQEIVALPRFVATPPSAWPEQGIFRSENQYADRLLRGDLAKKYSGELNSLKGKFADVLAEHLGRKAGPLPSGVPSASDWRPVGGASCINFINQSFHTAFDSFARRWCIVGIDAKGQPIPVGFRIHRQATGMSIFIPRYMKLDLKRHFPSDVRDFVHTRTLHDDNPAIEPRRYSITPLTWEGDVVQDRAKLVRERYQELISCKRKMKRHDIYVRLNQEFRLTIARDTSDQIRSIRRTLRSYGIS